MALRVCMSIPSFASCTVTPSSTKLAASPGLQWAYTHLVFLHSILSAATPWQALLWQSNSCMGIVAQHLLEHVQPQGDLSIDSPQETFSILWLFQAPGLSLKYPHPSAVNLRKNLLRRTHTITFQVFTDSLVDPVHSTATAAYSCPFLGREDATT